HGDVLALVRTRRDRDLERGGRAQGREGGTQQSGNGSEIQAVHRSLFLHLIECRYASRSAMAGTSICFSSPSSMNDNPVLRSSSMSIRKTVSLVPSARRSVRSLAVSAVIIPVMRRPAMVVRT